MTINWRERVFAATIHFSITLLVAGFVSVLIFFIWFPGSTASVVGGAQLFLLVFVSDVVLGPLLSLVIYSSAKSRRNLIIDYCAIGSVQLAALIYGVYALSVSRPVFVAFDTNRIEMVTAAEIHDSHLAAATDEQYRSLSWSGPKLVAVERPTDAKERSEIVFGVVLGNNVDVAYRPKYYRDYNTARQQILAKSLPLTVLLKNSDTAMSKIESAVASTGKSSDEIRWLLVHHRFGFAVALIDANTAVPLTYVAVDPVWIRGDYDLNRSR
jgi:ABC-type transport system involved in multi-copper enzyme maturation permease subunit